jgi:DNA adenine methylase
MSRSNAVAALSQRPRNLRERAFATVLRNRVNRGGIMAPGASLQKSGENGKGIASRWYAHTLVNRLAAIRMLRDKITFVHCDGVKFIGQHISEIDTAFFIDPPYTAGGKRAGSRLYVHNALDHDNLFDAMARVRGSFLMTYDDADEVRAMAKVRNFTVNEIAMKSTHHAVNVELLITNEAIG